MTEQEVARSARERRNLGGFGVHPALQRCQLSQEQAKDRSRQKACPTDDFHAPDLLIIGLSVSRYRSHCRDSVFQSGVLGPKLLPVQLSESRCGCLDLLANLVRSQLQRRPLADLSRPYS